jgi:hypothetical protein
MRKILLTLLILIAGAAGKINAEITTPYPKTIEIKQINSAEKERLRLCQGHKKYDKQPTGFYVETGKKVVVEVEILTPAAQNVMPVLAIGTLGFNVDGRNTGVSTTLAAGENTITNHSGGLIWLSFTQDGGSNPTGVARITFTDASEQVRVPRFVYGTTTNAEFKEMLTSYTTPDVLFQSDYVLVVATREAANQYSKDNNKVAWLNSLHTLLEKEDEISGMDNNDPNPLHHRLKAGEVRFLLTENTSDNPHASYAGYTGYPHGSRHRYLTELGVNGNGSWMLGHELGHQHQQPAYQINKATESTVNIYSYVVERNIQNSQGASYNRTSAARWVQARNTYLQLPFSKRVYDMPSMATDNDFDAFLGFNRDELRFMVWEQFFLIFGDQFYKTLHRVVREEKVIGGDADARRSYLIWKASQVTGYDLTEFLNLWGIRVTDAAIKADLRAKMAHAKANSTIQDLSAIGRTDEDLLSVTGQNLPAWTPIALRGITSSTSGAPETLDRSEWTVVTSYAGPTDDVVGGDSPEYIIDESATTAFAFVKPGKDYRGITVASDAVPSFTIDMKSTQTFNCVTYLHRSAGNTSEYIRARQLSVYGSDNGSQFVPLKEHHVIDHEKNANEITIEFPAASFRYLRVVIEGWNTANGSTVQVADVKVGTKVPDEDLPTPNPLKFKVTVTADNGIITSQAGVNLADEDSDYPIHFTLAAGKANPVVTVDGETVRTTESNGTYSLTVKVTNHLDINIKSNTDTGFQTLSDNSPLSVYPNPVRAGQPFTLRADGDFSGATVGIYTVDGVKIVDGQKFTGQSVEQTIGVPGIYILEVKTAAGKHIARLVVK